MYVCVADVAIAILYRNLHNFRLKLTIFKLKNFRPSLPLQYK